MNLRNLLLTALFGLSATGAVIGTFPDCAPGTLAGYLGAPTCSFGTVAFKGEVYDLTLDVTSFSALNLGPVQAPLATASQINVGPPSVVNGAMALTSDFFKVGNNQHVVYQFGYIIDPPPPVIPGFDLEMVAFSPVFPGSATVTVDLCLNGFFVGDACTSVIDGTRSSIQSLTVFHKGGAVCNQCFDSVQFDPIGLLSVRMTLDLNSGGNGTSDIKGIRTTAQVIPEPSAIALGGIGLAALALLRRRR